MQFLKNIFNGDTGSSEIVKYMQMQRISDGYVKVRLKPLGRLPVNKFIGAQDKCKRHH